MAQHKLIKCLQNTCEQQFYGQCVVCVQFVACDVCNCNIFLTNLDVWFVVYVGFLSYLLEDVVDAK